MRKPKYPHITVPLVGEDGNAFAILGRAMDAMKRAGLPKETIDTFMDEARSSTYDHLVMTVLRWFSTNYEAGKNVCDNCGTDIEDYDILDLCDECFDTMPAEEPAIAGTWGKASESNA